MTSKLKISPEYKSLLTPLSIQEYEGLKQSIKSNGQFLPIIINDDDVILDGHNRYHVCEELSLEPLVKKVSLKKTEEIAYVVSVNANRRHLNPITMVILASRMYGDGLGHFGKKGTRDIALEFGVSKGSFDNATQVVLYHGPEKSLEMMTHDNFSLNKEAKKVLSEKRAANRREALKDATPQKSRLFCDDATWKAELKPGSIDAIITDPPYPREFLHTFEDLGRIAKKWLKPNGSLLVMSGQLFLPEVFQRLGKSNLQYYWTIGYWMPGGTKLIHTRPVVNRWKPILWYVKSDGRIYDGVFPVQSDWVASRPTKEDDDKNFTPLNIWQQSVSGMEALVKWCTKPGDTVFDPFMGTGTTGVAAIQLKRKFIGADTDPDMYKDAQGRIAEAEKEAEKNG